MSEKECLTQLIILIEHFNNGGLDFNATDIVAIKYLLSKNEQLKKENKEYEEVINKLRQTLNPEMLDMLPFDISEQIICLFEGVE